jgi:hypothetical protein
MKKTCLGLAWVAPWLVLLGAPSAAAQGADAATAQALFEEGRALLQAEKTAQACPKLAESHRLDPAMGTLLALALCHEKEGKLASAWAEFTEVEGLARRGGRQDRERLAKEHAAALRGRMSTLLIEVPAPIAATPGLEIRRNGVPLGRGAWNTAAPVDGGQYAIQVAAPGKKSWEGVVVVKPESDKARMTVPPLTDESTLGAAAVASSGQSPAPNDASAKSAEHAPAGKPWGVAEWAGVAMVGAGAIALGTSGYFLASALSHKKDAEPHCQGNYCNATGLSERETAAEKGNVATALSITGGALVAAGVVTFFVGRSSSGKDAGVAAFVAPTPAGFSCALTGRF